MKVRFRTGAFIWAALLVLGLCGSTSALVLPVPQCYQQRDQWCWAGTSQAVLAFYGTNVSQADIAMFGTGGANVPNLLYGSSTDPDLRGVDLILAQFRGIDSTAVGYDLTLEEAQAEIDTRGRPLVILWKWQSGAGHILVLHGISGQYAYLMDPWNGPTINTFTWVQQGGGHEYIDTLKLTTPAGTLEVLPATHDYGLVPVGGVSEHAFTLTNSGRGIACGAAWPMAPFQVTSGCPYTLHEGESQVVTLRYSTTMPGNYTRAVAFTGGGGAVSLLSGYTLAAEFSGDAALSALPRDFYSAVAVSGGEAHALALRGDGTVLAWGDNSAGQTDVPGSATRVVAVSAGRRHNLALRADGRVIAWGDDSAGQTNVPPLSNIVAIAAGGRHSLALDAEGNVIAWGDDAFGQSSPPAGAKEIVAIAAGAYHSLAMKSDGQIIGWGRNDSGQADPPAHTKEVVALAAGAAHSLALNSDGSVLAWGDDTYGQISVPASATNVVAIAATGNHSLALRADGIVIGWGDNQFEQVEFGPGATNVVALGAGERFSLLVRSSPAVAPRLFGQARPYTQLVVPLPTVARATYYLERAPALFADEWSPVDSVIGNGSVRQVRDAVPGSVRQFYRVRVAVP